MVDVESVVDDGHADAAAPARLPCQLGAHVRVAAFPPRLPSLFHCHCRRYCGSDGPNAGRQVLDHLRLGILDCVVVLQRDRDVNRILPGGDFNFVKVFCERQLAQDRHTRVRQTTLRLFFWNIDS